MELPEVQILAVVANIQIKSLNTEVGNGSMSTAFVHGLVGPEEKRNCVNCLLLTFVFVSRVKLRKGIRLIFLNSRIYNLRQRSMIIQMALGSLGKVLFFS